MNEFKYRDSRRPMSVYKNVSFGTFVVYNVMSYSEMVIHQFYSISILLYEQELPFLHREAEAQGPREAESGATDESASALDLDYLD